MKSNGIKIASPSKYWFDSEGESFQFLMTIKWQGLEDNKSLSDKLLSFLSEYLKLTEKYQILIPVLDVSQYDIVILQKKLQQDLDLVYPSNNKDEWISLSFLYFYRNLFLYPSLLFVKIDNHIFSKKIYDIKFLTSINNFEENNISASGMPIRIRFYKNRINEASIVLDFCTDLFFPKLNFGNKKVKKWTENEEIKNNGIDNSELAYLNTTRLNSFLRDLKNMCFEFGSSSVEFNDPESNYPNHTKCFSENGVLFDDEIIYYEDIYDLLPEEYRCNKFEEVQVKIDDRKYQEYINKRIKTD
jgi:hypothetical protein